MRDTREWSKLHNASYCIGDKMKTDETGDWIGMKQEMGKQMHKHCLKSFTRKVHLKELGLHRTKY
jgi:predicted Fe-S protein YdhL (DUF1289 family)